MISSWCETCVSYPDDCGALEWFKEMGCEKQPTIENCPMYENDPDKDF